eukprot:sb/3478956/
MSEVCGDRTRCLCHQDSFYLIGKFGLQGGVLVSLTPSASEIEPPKKGSCLSKALAHDPLDRLTSRLFPEAANWSKFTGKYPRSLSANRKWVKIDAEV